MLCEVLGRAGVPLKLRYAIEAAPRVQEVVRQRSGLAVQLELQRNS